MLVRTIGNIGDMTKTIYDTDNDGVVDETEKIDGGVWT